ncbi:MAG: DUF5655 domain-containing protein [Eubacteriales bacterium]|nr:DUF5655 domain-containing protein [Eubacteriales bacterium]
MTADELQFFDKLPQMLPLYIALREKLDERYPDMTLKITKTQISFRNRHVFAMASLPMRRLKGWPREYLLVSFGLSHQKLSPRIAQSVEPYPGRWTHHVPITAREDLDEELLGWLDEAWQFALYK